MNDWERIDRITRMQTHCKHQISPDNELVTWNEGYKARRFTCIKCHRDFWYSIPGRGKKK